MSHIDRVAATAVMALAFIAPACAPPDGSPEDISDIPNKTLTVKHDSFASDGLVVTLDYFDPSYRCAVLDNDAFARLNGRSVPLFRGEEYVIPPQGDDGGIGCTNPSVTLDQIPPDLAPPWTIEIGDTSEVVAATFGPDTINPFDVGPLTNTQLAASFEDLDVLIRRHAGDETPAAATATLTASEGQLAIRTGEITGSSIRFPSAFDPGWPPGPVTVQIEVDYAAPDVLLNCQNATCSLVSEPGTCSRAPGGGAGAPCTSFSTLSTTNEFSIQLICGPLAACP